MDSPWQSIQGIPGYFAKGVSIGWAYCVCPTMVGVSMESVHTLPKGIHGLEILCMSNIGQSIHGIPSKVNIRKYTAFLQSKVNIRKYTVLLETTLNTQTHTVVIPGTHNQPAITFYYSSSIIHYNPIYC